MEPAQSPRSFKDLIVWQKSIALVTEVYRLTKKFPSEERFSLTSQIRRAAASIPANIAEGNGRGTRKDYAHFLHIAHGSAAELETLLTIAQNLQYCNKNECSTIEGRLGEIGRMLRSLRTKLRPSVPYP